MELAIMIPTTDHRAAPHNAERLAPEGWRNPERVLWPEVSSRGVPLFPSEIAAETQATIEDWIDRGVARAVIVTRSEMVVLRARRMIAEGAQFTAAVYVGNERHEILPNGEVASWTKGLFSEDFEELKAIRAAQRGASK